jgi:hypothetical protein
MSMFKYETYTHIIMATRLSHLLSLSLFFALTALSIELVYLHERQRKKKKTKMFTTQKGVKQMRVN